MLSARGDDRTRPARTLTTGERRKAGAGQDRASSLLRGMRGPSALLAASLTMVGCGYVSPGEDLSPHEAGVRDGDGSDAAVDGGDLADASVEDTAIADADCVQIEPPAFPTSWPFPATKEAYLSEFAQPIDESAGQRGYDSDTCVLCHPQEVRSGTNDHAPFLPRKADPAFESPALLNRVLQEIWASAQPPAAGDPAMIKAHVKGPEGEGPPGAPVEFNPGQVAALRRLIERGANCRWVGVDPKEGECAPPNTDHCAAQP